MNTIFFSTMDFLANASINLSYDQNSDKWDGYKDSFGLKSESNYLINLLRVFSLPKFMAG